MLDIAQRAIPFDREPHIKVNRSVVVYYNALHNYRFYDNSVTFALRACPAGNLFSTNSLVILIAGGAFGVLVILCLVVIIISTALVGKRSRKTK